MSVSYEALSDYIVSIRQRVCPRTSYATSGTAASIAVALVASHYHQQFMLLSELLKQSKEFQKVEVVTKKEELLHQVNGNLVIIFGEGEASSDAIVDELLAKGKTKLVIYILPNNDNEEIMTKLKGSEMFSKISQRFDCAEALSCFQYRKVRSAGPPTKAFNGQPSVQSGMQFRFLWSPSTPQTEGGKDRVLQRLADKSLADGRKLSAPEWDRLVRAALDRGLDDYGVYNLIREKTLGSSLAKDLEEQVRGASTKATSAADSGRDGEEGAGGEDGRATHMMARTLDSIPEHLRQAASPAQPTGLRCMLDYGCAEGAITAALGKQLGLAPNRILGADVRAIPSLGFTFIPLPAEEAATPPPLGTILPNIPNQSVDLITAAMVFHHVTHVKAALLELRRIVSPTGALVIREHHCSSADMGAFLDITHGLYSLAWSKPVEWPDFIPEYKAFYRSREAWDALAQECGFTLSLSAQAQRNYRAAEFAQRKANGYFPNVIKAYYAVYTPNPQFRLPSVAVVPRSVTSSSNNSSSSGSGSNTGNSNSAASNIGVGIGKAGTEESSAVGSYKRRASEVAEEGAAQRDERKRPREPAEPGEGGQEQLFESSKYPGRYYRINKTTGATEWVS